MPAFPCFGLTGGVACGKSTVASHFASLGAKLIDADRIGHEMLESRGVAFDEVVRQFGKQILDPSGSIDRKRLGAIVFSNPELRQKLNAILHPRIIRKHEELALELYRADSKAVIVVEAALIYEARAEDRFTRVIAVWCAPEQQIARLTSKTGISREQAGIRVGSQMSGDEKRRRADFVIDCSGSLDHARGQVEQLYPTLQRLVVSETGFLRT